MRLRSVAIGLVVAGMSLACAALLVRRFEGWAWTSRDPGRAATLARVTMAYRWRIAHTLDGMRREDVIARLGVPSATDETASVRDGMKGFIYTLADFDESRCPTATYLFVEFAGDRVARSHVYDLQGC